MIKGILTSTVVERIEESEQSADGEDVVVLMEVRHFGGCSPRRFREQRTGYE